MSKVSVNKDLASSGGINILLKNWISSKKDYLSIHFTPLEVAENTICPEIPTPSFGSIGELMSTVFAVMIIVNEFI